MFARFYVRSCGRVARLSAFAFAIFVAVALMTALQVHADDYWSASAGDWSVASNWGGSLLPTSSDTAWITNGGTATITMTGEVCESLSLGGSEGGTVQMTGGDLTTAFENVGCSVGNGTFTQSGGINIISDPNVVPNRLYIGETLGTSGTYNLTGGLLSTPENEYVGCRGVGTFNQSGGTNSIGYNFYLGFYPGSSGTYNLSGGLLVIDAFNSPSGTFNFSGGTLQTYAIDMPVTLGTSGGGATFDAGGYYPEFDVYGSLSGPGSLTKVDSVRWTPFFVPENGLYL